MHDSMAVASSDTLTILVVNVPEGKSEEEISNRIENSGGKITQVTVLPQGVARVTIDRIEGLSIIDCVKKICPNADVDSIRSVLEHEFILDWRSLTESNSVDKQKNITVVKGNIALFKDADVLVNPVAKTNTDLKHSGEVSKAFCEHGGNVLLKEYKNVRPPKDFGTDVAVTGPAGAICCKKIFHPAIRGYRNENSIMLLKLMIEFCLKKAESLNMKSIAFPTVGCGRLKYDPNQVANCFVETAKKTTLQIYVVAYKEEIYEIFRKAFPSFDESSGGQRVDLTATPTLSSPIGGLIKIIIDGKLSNNMQSRIEMPIVHPAIAELNTEITSSIQDLQTTEVQIRIEPSQSTITLIGKREVLQEVKQRILKLLAEDELVQKNLDYIKTTKGVREYLMALSQKNFIGFPVYWKNSTFPDLSKAESKRCRLIRCSQAYDAVKAFVLNTWIPSLATYGRDARGLVHSNITVGNIWTIENPLLYTNYQFKLKALARKAADKPFSAVSGLLGEQEIMTKQITGVDYLNSQLIGELNEVYLFHGTSHVDEIIRNGIDSRFSGDRVLFGRGAYFAESSTKSDQYADPTGGIGRASADKPLYMFVARVLLGQPFVALEARPHLKRAPCSTLGCKRDNCCNNHPMCDSVIGAHRDVSTPLLFREFIVYHPDQCYPEFLVEYVRQ